MMRPPELLRCCLWCSGLAIIDYLQLASERTPDTPTDFLKMSPCSGLAGLAIIDYLRPAVGRELNSSLIFRQTF
eukprot:4250198-Amphidinium_carterae.1